MESALERLDGVHQSFASFKLCVAPANVAMPGVLPVGSKEDRYALGYVIVLAVALKKPVFSTAQAEACNW